MNLIYNIFYCIFIYYKGDILINFFTTNNKIKIKIVDVV